MPLELATPVASDTSKVEDPVRATLRTGVSVDGVQALPVGTTVLGHVTSAERSAKVKGRASIGFRFTQIDLPGDGGREPISTGRSSRVAAATKKKDAAKIGVGAGAGAVIGGIIGGGDGAAKGAAIGGGAGTGGRPRDARRGSSSRRRGAGLGEAHRAAHGPSRREIGRKETRLRGGPTHGRAAGSEDRSPRAGLRRYP